MKVKVIAFALLVAGCAPAAQPPVGTSPTGHTSSLLVTNLQTCPSGHSCDILEIVDIHTAASTENKGFDELRAMARARQADAVIGAEFEHGGNDNPSHLSGMIVRYGRPIPAHTTLGDIEVSSDGTDRDKGLAELAAKGAAMGGDQVIDVTFEHGEDGAKGSLKGRAIRFDR